MHFERRRGHAALALLGACLAGGAGSAFAQDVSLSGFGTVGYAQSNRDFVYQRSIDDGGTFTRDSVLGLQGDLRLTPQWSAALQLRLGQSLRDDEHFDLRPSWAFVAWRPSDDWLLRAGRLRVPLYLHSEALDVGVAHDMARLPYEMYSITPSADFNGLAVAKTWLRDAGELSLDAYSGRIGTTGRFYLRDGIPGQMPAGPRFVDVNMRVSGMVFTWRSLESTWRVGLHRTDTRKADGKPLPVRYPYVEVAPGVAYYQVGPSLPGPGWDTVAGVRNTIFTLGAEQALAPDWRLTAEYARMRQSGSELGSDSTGGYVALFHAMGAFTPYVSWGQLRSNDTTLGWYRRLTQTQLPAYFPGAANINAAMRAAGESGYATDQRTWALGTTYQLDGRSKIKAELAHTHIGEVSRAADSAAGRKPAHDTGVNVWSLNYSFSF